LLRPKFVAGCGVEAAGDFVAAAAGEDIQLVADPGGRGDPITDSPLPLLRERFGPGLRRLEARRNCIAICAAPLGPVLPEKSTCPKQCHTADKNAHLPERASHSGFLQAGWNAS